MTLSDPAPAQPSPAIKLHMPDRLVMVRHGESEANLINRALKAGTLQSYPRGFAEIPDREIRLSPLGRQQAVLTGEWLAVQYPEGFDAIYVSDHIRAQETAGLICKAAGWHNVEIRIDPLIGERNWGQFASKAAEQREQIMQMRKRDPLHNPMPNGETLLETRDRSRHLLDRCAREFAGRRVLEISHGEFIEALWAEIAHMNTERQLEFFSSEAGDIKNCQVVEFSAANPENGEYRGNLGWVRSSHPASGLDGCWGGIERIRYTPDQLLDQVSFYPRFSFPQG